MDIEKIFNLKDILITDMNKQYVVLTTKRNFLNEDSPLFVKPRYKRIEEILSQIRTDDAIENIEMHMQRMKEKLESRYCNFNKIEERITVGILMERDKYEQIHQKTKNYSDEEVLHTNIIDMDILKWTIHNVVEIYPYMMRYNDENNSSKQYQSGYVVVEPSKLINFKDLCNVLAGLGYKIDLLKGSGELLKEQDLSRSNDEPYRKLCALLLNNKGVYTDGIEYGYSTDIVIVSNNKSNDIKNKPVRVRK